MSKRVTVTQAAKQTGLSEYAIRTGIKQGRIPHIRTSGFKGKILLDIDLVEQSLRQEAINSTIDADNDNVKPIGYGTLRAVKA